MQTQHQQSLQSFHEIIMVVQRHSAFCQNATKAVLENKFQRRGNLRHEAIPAVYYRGDSVRILPISEEFSQLEISNNWKALLS